MVSHKSSNFLLFRNLLRKLFIPFISIWLFFALSIFGYADHSLLVSEFDTASISNGLNENIYDVESFERGSYSGTNYMAGAGTITNDPQKVITGQYSAYLDSQPTQEWRDVAYSDASKIRFEKNTTYSVTFSYKSIVDPVKANNGYFYFAARGVGSDHTSDLGWTEWNDQAGKIGTKTIVFTTEDKENYFLIWGIHNGGALSLDDIYIQKRSESFERGSYTGTNYIAGAGALTNDPQKVITGQYSAYLDSQPTQAWRDVAYSDTNKIRFEKNTTYSVTFSYKSIVDPVKENNGYFYFVARGVGSDYTSDRGWTEWNDQAGKTGTKTIVFTTGDKENYFLIWGIHNGGALSLDDIYIEKRSESFERGSYTGTNYIAGAGTITDDPQKVITGRYSAYLASQPTQAWRDVAYSDTNKIRFEKNTTYSVTFSYKSIVDPVKANNGYFYFAARGVGSDYTSDKGWTEWNDQAGKIGTKTIVFTTGDREDYFLIWGIHNGGALSLDDIIIEKNKYQYDQNGRLIKFISPNQREIKYDYDLNGNIIRRKVE
ncbi:hypothetical protein ABEX47_28720 [Paenibacillus ehimensis]|uniref:hypothetical protein n=2 Tax=Paenibacillus ehimensis TaxID=79264 RepID=UPI002DB8AA28|nr:hypothetical protein [Paenibacillus ehimensis]MEC0208528.1 hypothetical protein [Paenibacillus ehimensis]